MISVVVSLYNVEKYIAGCLSSIVQQTFRDFELILVDDGSTDNSVSVAQEYLKKTGTDYRLILKKNGGQSSARNAGLRESKGDFVVFIDSDDVVSKDFLEILINAFEDNTDFTFCNYEFVKTQDPPIDDNDKWAVFNRNEMIEQFLKRTIGFVVPSMMFKRSFLIDNNLFFRENIRFSEDQMFIWETIFACKQVNYLYRKAYGYYVREQSIMTGSPYNKIVSGFKVYSDFCDELKEKHPEYLKEISMILPRWELGTLYSSASLLEYEEYLKVYKMMDGKKIFRKIAGINEIKAYLLATVSSLSPKLLYRLCRRMDLNG